MPNAGLENVVYICFIFLSTVVNVLYLSVWFAITYLKFFYPTKQLIFKYLYFLISNFNAKNSEKTCILFVSYQIKKVCSDHPPSGVEDCLKEHLGSTAIKECRVVCTCSVEFH